MEQPVEGLALVEVSVEDLGSKSFTVADFEFARSPGLECPGLFSFEDRHARCKMGK